jgi:hypothetical protein
VDPLYRAVLDQRSDELAASLLAPLSARQGARLVAAMADVERLLTAAMVEVTPACTDPPATSMSHPSATRPTRTTGSKGHHLHLNRIGRQDPRDERY